MDYYYVGFMFSLVLWYFILIVHSPTACSANAEGDALYAFRNGLRDPRNVLQSWDPTLVNPCTWFHISCNSENAVTIIDVVNSGLSGPLSPQLGILRSLQRLELFGNKLYGSIPKELGNLKDLVSLDLFSNKLGGDIPVELEKLTKLKFIQLQYNNLTGRVPKKLTFVPIHNFAHNPYLTHKK